MQKEIFYRLSTIHKRDRQTHRHHGLVTSIPTGKIAFEQCCLITHKFWYNTLTVFIVCENVQNARSHEVRRQLSHQTGLHRCGRGDIPRSNEGQADGPESARSISCAEVRADLQEHLIVIIVSMLVGVLWCFIWQRVADCHCHRHCLLSANTGPCLTMHRWPSSQAFGRSGPPVADRLGVTDDVAVGMTTGKQRPVASVGGPVWLLTASCDEGSPQCVTECLAISHWHDVVQNWIQRCTDKIQNACKQAIRSFVFTAVKNAYCMAHHTYDAVLSVIGWYNYVGNAKREICLTCENIP